MAYRLRSSGQRKVLFLFGYRPIGHADFHLEVSIEFSSDALDESPRFEMRDLALDPEQICDQNQRCIQMIRTIRTLEPSLRSALQIRMTRATSLREVARTLETTEAAVKASLYRARRRLSAEVRGMRGTPIHIESRAT